MGNFAKFIPYILVVLTGLMIAGKVAYTSYFAKPIKTAGQTAVNVGVRTVVATEYDETLELPGRLMAEQEITLSSELTGRIERWLINEGDSVKKGQVVAVLDRSQLKSQLSELSATRPRALASIAVAKSAVKMAEIALKAAGNDVNSAKNRLAITVADEALARDELSRTEALYEKKISSKTDLDRRRTDYTRAKLEVLNAKNSLEQARNTKETSAVDCERADAGVLQATAQLREVEAGIKSIGVNLTKSEIISPIAGVFDEFMFEAGEVVQPGEPMGSVFDYSSIRIRIDVADRYAPFLEKETPLVKNYIAMNFPGARQNLNGTLVLPGLPTLNGGRSEGIELPATIVRIGKSADPTSNTFAVELRSINPGNVFKQGLLGRARLKVLTYKAALQIPLAAIRVTENGPRCLVAVKDSAGYHAESREIMPCSIRDNLVMVRGELKEGDRLVVTGVQEILDGQLLTIINSDKTKSSTKE